jgi:putative chitinase
MFVDANKIKKVLPSLSLEFATRVAHAINAICPLYGINTYDILHEWIANVAHESKNFTDMEENLRYSAKRLTEVWKGRFPTLAKAKPYAYNPKALAEKVYGFRADLGNNKDGDGWLFRGGGLIQNTGRLNYTLFTIYYNKKFGTKYTVEQIADLIRTDFNMAMHNACWFFAIAKSLIPYAISDNMKYIVKKINGGYIGLSERNIIYARAKLHLI